MQDVSNAIQVEESLASNPSLDNEPIMLTTIDNPFNPFKQFDEWDAYDKQKGYYTCAYLDRVAIFSYELSDADQAIAVDNAIDEIIKEDPLGIYIKVTENYFKTEVA